MEFTLFDKDGNELGKYEYRVTMSPRDWKTFRDEYEYKPEEWTPLFSTSGEVSLTFDLGSSIFEQLMSTLHPRADLQKRLMRHVCTGFTVN